jgi:uncharacterized protein YecE (DUF72 family)
MPKARAIAKARARVRHGLTSIGATGHGELRIGISGWRYPGWRGKFYPKDLPQHRELEFAGSTFNSVEINGSFYSLQLPSSYQRWYEATPSDFLFAVKGGRFITHMKKLRNVETALANFFASGVLALREKLGPFLWQLPPSLGFDPERLRNFFALLPRDTGQAARLAKKHDDKLKTRAFARINPAAPTRPLRHAFEVRHSSFMTAEFFQMLRDENMAFVIADTAGKFPYAEEVTADFIYIRLHGAEKLYVSGYDDGALGHWANKIKRWRNGPRPRDVFIYFDNDAKVHAPFDAIRLAERLNLKR